MSADVDDRFSRGTWTRKPVRATRDGAQALVVEAAEGSDWWRDTAYGFRHDNGHALLAPWVPDTAVEVTFDLVGFTGEFDQAGALHRGRRRPLDQSGHRIQRRPPTTGRRGHVGRERLVDRGRR